MRLNHIQLQLAIFFCFSECVLGHGNHGEKAPDQAVLESSLEELESKWGFEVWNNGSNHDFSLLTLS
jgi:hypothetical protein